MSDMSDSSSDRSDGNDEDMMLLMVMISPYIESIHYILR